MSRTAFVSDRRFQIWKFHRSHSQLLLQSNPTTDGELRIEVLFRGVTAMKLSNPIDGILIRPATEPEWSEIDAEIASPPPGSGCFIVASSDFEGYVVGIRKFWVREADLTYAAPSTLLIE